MMKIIIATGASGGHIFPALNVAQELRKQGHSILFVGVFKQWEALIGDNNYSFRVIPAKGWGIKSLKYALVSIGCMLKSVVIAFKIIKEYKPDRILGFGGYASFPVVLMGSFQGVFSAIHEQNVVPGRANRILGKVVQRVFISFDQSKRYFKGTKVVVSGYPLRDFQNRTSPQECRRDLGLEPGRLTIAVCGGSQGSRTLNQVMIQAAELLKLEIDFQVVHITGVDDHSLVEMAYQRLEIPAHVFYFCEEMEKVYQAADLIVARAGAGAVHEIAYFKKPALIVPYPYAGDHQKHNARALAEAGQGIIIEESRLTAKRLREEISRIIRGDMLNLRKEKKHHLCNENAAQLIAEALIETK